MYNNLIIAAFKILSAIHEENLLVSKNISIDIFSSFLESGIIE